MVQSMLLFLDISHGTNYANLKNYKAINIVCCPMFNKHTTLYAAVIASVLVASVFAISFVQQQAMAQGNQTTGATGGTNQSSSNSTGSGAATTGGTTTGSSSGPTY